MLSQFHSIPYVLNLCPRIFGCICYVRVYSHLRDKLDPRALKCVFLDYSNSQKGYKCFHPPLGKYYVSMEVQFNDVSLIFLRMWTWFLFKGRLIVRKRKGCGWKKRGGGFQVRGRTWNWMIHESQSLNAKKTIEIPNGLFQQHYSRKNKDTTGVPSLSSNASLNDITIPSNVFSRIDSEVQILHL